MNLSERDQNHLWHPYTQEKIAPLPIPIVRAKGVWLETEDGRKILDGISSWWVNIHGHSHPVLNQALAEQAKTLEHVMFAGFTVWLSIFRRATCLVLVYCCKWYFSISSESLLTGSAWKAMLNNFPAGE